VTLYHRWSPNAGALPWLHKRRQPLGSALFRILQKQPHVSLQNVNSIGDIGVTVPIDFTLLPEEIDTRLGRAV
jgi:hypothetical protein